MTLVACGGSGGDITGGGNGGGTETVTLQLAKSDGNLSGTNDITIGAKVMQGTSVVANKLVTFVLTDPSLATFEPSVGTAVTNDEGIATILVKATNIPGGVEVTATISDVDPVAIGFTSDGGGPGGETDPVTLSFTASSGDLSGDNDITITATIMSGDTPVTNKLVSFTLTDATLATFLPEVGTAVTNSQGIASIILKATNIAGGVEVTVNVTGFEPSVFSFTSLGGGPGGDTGGNPLADSVTLFASSQQLASSGAQSVTLTAVAKDVNNNLLQDVEINFSADSGALQKVLDENGESSDVTGPDGKLTRKLSTLAEPTNRIISVTVTSGSVSDSVEVQVVGTTITLTGSSSLALNDVNNYIIKVLDSDGNGLANTPVILSLSNQSTETPAGTIANITLPESVTTDFNGQATVSVVGTSGGTNSIIATAYGASSQKMVAVQSDSFLFTNFSDGTNNIDPSSDEVPDVLLSEIATVTLTWLRNGVPVPDGTVVSFTTTRGDLSSSSATTVAGKVTTTITSKNAGKSLITFTGTDTVNGKVIELSNQFEFEFVADTASRLIAQAFPNSIGPDGQTSTISVVVRDPDGNLVKNKTVDFVLTDISGGAIFPASAVTDSNGTASTVYTSNSVSAQNSVKISATVNGTGVSDDAYLTVADRELFITLGTGNTLEEYGVTDYIKEYSVFVTDVDSNPVPNVDLTISAIPHQYYKGYWVRLYDGVDFKVWMTNALPGDVQGRNAPISCANEDINLDGILDAGEDTNGDGMLTPGNIVAGDGTVTTDDNGRAIVKINYGQSYGHWTDIRLIASTKVTGSEILNQTVFTLPVIASDINDEDLTPPTQGIGLEGPFGAAQDCSVSH